MAANLLNRRTIPDLIVLVLIWFAAFHNWENTAELVRPYLLGSPERIASSAGKQSAVMPQFQDGKYVR